MYMLLMIFSIFNMNDESWGTRETIQNQNQVIHIFMYMYNRINYLNLEIKYFQKFNVNKITDRIKKTNTRNK